MDNSIINFNITDRFNIKLATTDLGLLKAERCKLIFGVVLLALLLTFSTFYFVDDFYLMFNAFFIGSGVTFILFIVFLFVLGDYANYAYYYRKTKQEDRQASLLAYGHFWAGMKISCLKEDKYVMYIKYKKGKKIPRKYRPSKLTLQSESPIAIVDFVSYMHEEVINGKKGDS